MADTKKNKTDSKVETGDEKQLNVATDIFGFGEMSSSTASVINNTVDSISLKSLGVGFRSFYALMFLWLIAIIVVPALGIPSFAEFRFDIILYLWIGVVFFASLAFGYISILNHRKNKKNKVKK